MIKFKLPGVQQSMQLYLANRETESILFRPIRNNIVGTFAQLGQLLSQHYSSEELMLIACPLPEQVSVMLSSSSLQGVKQEANTEENQVSNIQVTSESCTVAKSAENVNLSTS